MNRIKRLREEKGLNQVELGKIIGVSGQALGMYENEKRDLSTDTVIKLAEYFNVSTDYLLGKSNKRDFFNNDNKFFLCPVYGKISAGQPNWAEECLDGYLPVDPNLMDIANPEECFFLKVDGESMNKVVRNGAYALIRKTDFVDNDEIAVVLVNGCDATLKKFSKEGDIIVLSPESTDNSFKQQIYTKETPIKVIGKYIGKMEFNER